MPFGYKPIRPSLSLQRAVIMLQAVFFHRESAQPRVNHSRRSCDFKGNTPRSLKQGRVTTKSFETDTWQPGISHVLHEPLALFFPFANQLLCQPGSLQAVFIYFIFFKSIQTCLQLHSLGYKIAWVHTHTSLRTTLSPHERGKSLPQRVPKWKFKAKQYCPSFWKGGENSQVEIRRCTEIGSQQRNCKSQNTSCSPRVPLLRLSCHL